MEVVLAVLIGAVLVGLAGSVLVWRDRRRGPVCPWCGKSNTFGRAGADDVCGHCGFDFSRDDY